MNVSVKPLISVIIPTYARPDRLRLCLTALSALHYPRRRFEVVVVDDGSPEPPVDLVAEFAKLINIRLLQQLHAGPASARNAGATEARGEFLAFTDDDCMPTPYWLTEMEACLCAAPGDLVAGRVVNALRQNSFSTASQLLVDYLISHFNADYLSACFVTSNNMGIARQAFLDVGGFNTLFRRAAGEDREFSDRWRAMTRKIRFRAEVLVEHSHYLTLSGFCQQHFNYGRGAWDLRLARATRHLPPLPLESWEFYSNLVLFPLRQPELQRRMPLIALLVLSQIVNASGYFYMRFLSLRKGSETLRPGNVWRRVFRRQTVDGQGTPETRI